MPGLVETLKSCLLAHRVSLSQIEWHGRVTVYLLRIEGYPAEYVTNSGFPDFTQHYRFPVGAFPILPERLEWLRDVCAQVWERGGTLHDWTYRGPPEQPSFVRLRDVPRWALSAIGRLAAEALARDRPRQAPYGPQSPYR